MSALTATGVAVVILLQLPSMSLIALWMFGGNLTSAWTGAASGIGYFSPAFNFVSWPIALILVAVSPGARRSPVLWASLGLGVFALSRYGSVIGFWQ